MSASLRPKLISLDRLPSVLLLTLLAAALRLPLVFIDYYHHPDEIWQYIEPAYGIVTGWSVRTWEYREGIRSWLIPTLLLPPVWLGHVVAPNSLLFLKLARALASILSLLIVACGTAIALRQSRLHGMIVGLVLSLHFELLYFASRTLSEVLSADFFFLAAWLLLPHAKQGWRGFAGGTCLGLCFAMRLQLAPTLVVFGFCVCRSDWRAWRTVAGGGLVALALDGLIDACHGQIPLSWVWANVHSNLVVNRSSDYGTEPVGWYISQLLSIWSCASIPIAIAAVFGARRQPALAAAMLINLAVHSAIPHKEYRFIFLSVALLILLAALGSAELIELASHRRRSWARVALAVAGLLWLGSMGNALARPAVRTNLIGNRGQIAHMRAAGDISGLCGLAELQPARNAALSYTYLNRPVPIFYFVGSRAVANANAVSHSYNVLYASRNLGRSVPGYHLESCLDRSMGQDLCVFSRPGICAPADERFTINRVLAQEGD